MSQTASSPVKDGEEPRYIDRNRPLAEQIAEQSKPKTYKNTPPENTETVEVIGVRFREAGKVYYFAPGECKVAKGEAVIVETARGVEYGFCAIANRFVSIDNIVPPLKPIVRVATTDDTERYEGNKQLEEGAAKVFREKVRALGLEMSLVYVEYTFDNGKLLFYFTADGRVDFRELIKELAAAFRTRIELRQIGVRDEAKIVGGLGICGRPVCCKSFLGEFSQVSIKMAKDQNLFINSSKISGTCGRFMCCIRYEDEVYQKEYERTPKVDAIVETPEGRGVVVESNALKGVVKVLLDDKPEEIAKPYKCTEVKLLGYVKRDDANELPEGVEIPEEGSGS
ncbi:MAG: stage 0 sporulation family protein [Clostridia bacterium]|nr:stage 0 sporulation family protein [Clostridia bacterium]